MWFGVAPAPAPSPRTNTKGWHPPHCTCGKHQRKTPLSPLRGSPKTSPRRPHDKELHSPRALNAVVTPLRRREKGRESERSWKERDRCDDEPHPVLSNSVLTTPAPLMRMTLSSTGARPRLGRSRGHEEAEPSPRSTKNDDAKLVFDLDHPVWNDTSQDRRHRGLISVDEWSAGESILGHAHRVSTPSSSSRPRSSRLGLRPFRESEATSTLRHVDDPEEGVAAASAPSKSRHASRVHFSMTGSTENGEFSDVGVHEQVSVATNRPQSSRGCTVEQLEQPVPTRVQPANLVGHTSSVSAVLVDDDRYIVSASIDGSVKVWARSNLDCLHTLYGHTDSVSCVDMNSKWLVSGSHDMTLRVYSLTSGFQCVYVLLGHSAHITRVQLRSHTHVMSCADDATLRLWNLDVGYCIAVFLTHSTRVTCFLLQADRLCSGAADASICFWTLENCDDLPEAACISALKTYRVHRSTIQCLLGPVDVDVNPSLIFSSSNDGTIQWFNSRTMLHLGRIDAVNTPIYSMILHPTSGELICSTRDGRVLIYCDPRHSTGRKRELRVASKWISTLQLLDDRRVACASDDHLLVVDLQEPRIVHRLDTAHGFINCARWLATSQQIITTGQDNVIKMWAIP